MIIPSPTQPRVIVRDGLVNETRFHRASGVEVILYDPPYRMFFIDFIDEQGDGITVWDGPTYADAIAAAEEWRRDGVLVDDRVSDEGGRA